MRKRFIQQGIETQGYHNYQQEERTEKTSFQGVALGFKCCGRAMGSGEGKVWKVVLEEGNFLT
jgi:hypothetical protein